MPTTRKVDDLYVLGRPLTLDDGQGDAVPVWLQKLDPVDSDTALRRSGGEKSKVLMVRNNPESEVWLELYADVADFDRETLTEYLITEDVLLFAEAREAEVAAEEEWSKDGYLQGLTDAWNDSLKRRWEDDPEDAEAKHCLDELTRFRNQVNTLVDAERVRLRRDFEGNDLEKMRRDVVTQFLESRAGQRWVTEWRRCEVAFGTRTAEDHTKYYFALPDGKPDHERVARLPPEVFGQIAAAYAEMVVPPDEGKDSPLSRSSSPPSEPSAEEATAAPSGPPVVAP